MVDIWLVLGIIVRKSSRNKLILLWWLPSELRLGIVVNQHGPFKVLAVSETVVLTSLRLPYHIAYLLLEHLSSLVPLKVVAVSPNHTLGIEGGIHCREIIGCVYSETCLLLLFYLLACNTHCSFCLQYAVWVEARSFLLVLVG